MFFSANRKNPLKSRFSLFRPGIYLEYLEAVTTSSDEESECFVLVQEELDIILDEAIR